MKKLLYILSSMMLWTSAHAMDESTAIIKVIKDYEQVLNTGNVKSILNLYGQDPIFMPQHSLAQEGRDAVENAYVNVFKNIHLDIKFSIYDIEVYNDTAWARTTSSGTVTILANNKTINEGNNEIFIFKKENNQWKIHRYLFSTSTPKHN